MESGQSSLVRDAWDSRPSRVYLSLGGNVGDRMSFLRAGVHSLAALDGTRLLRVSSVYETAPVGCLEQPSFLNLAVEIETAFEPLGLLNAVKDIERSLGRTPSKRWGPREIDVDVVLWTSLVMDEPALTLPHREFRNRAFVLAPLAEIAADAVDPVTGLTVAELILRPEASGEIRKLGPFA